jgi:hypothetical protein
MVEVSNGGTSETIEFTGSYTLTVDPSKERIILFYGGYQQNVSQSWTLDGGSSYTNPTTGMTGIGGTTSATRFFGGVYNWTQNYSYKVDSVSTHTWRNVDSSAPGLIAIIE